MDGKLGDQYEVVHITAAPRRLESEAAKEAIARYWSYRDECNRLLKDWVDSNLRVKDE